MDQFQLNLLPFEPLVDRIPIHDEKVIVEDSSQYHFPAANSVYPEVSSGDFLYSYHTVHELNDAPQRVQTYLDNFPSGLLITPSPLLEVMENIQPQFNPRTRGFVLSRYFIWCNQDTNEICFLPKYETVLDNCSLSQELYRSVVTSLVKEPVTINSYCYWVPQHKPIVRVYRQGLDFDVIKDVQSYMSLMNASFVQHVAHSNAWLRSFPVRLDKIDETV